MLDRVNDAKNLNKLITPKKEIDKWINKLKK